MRCIIVSQDDLSKYFLLLKFLCCLTAMSRRLLINVGKCFINNSQIHHVNCPAINQTLFIYIKYEL